MAQDLPFGSDSTWKGDRSSQYMTHETLCISAKSPNSCLMLRSEKELGLESARSPQGSIFEYL